MKYVRSGGRRHFAWPIGILVGLLLMAAASVRAGSVVAARGEVWVERGQQIVPLRPGAALQAADKLVTGPGAEVLVRFEDDARMLVRSDSTLDLRQLLRKDEIRQQIINIVKGGLRYLSSVTTVRQQVSFTSVHATIGIRGTDIEIALDETRANAKPAGTYLKVNHGIAVLTGLDGSEVELSEGQVALGIEAELSRAGVRSIRRPSAMRMDAAPAHLFQPGSMDSLLR
ncbi:MAG TPA: FecR domain-containing protein [Ramlibacter sp.]|nr:FecR domain-containing protein [Ramlibacter sp.]